MMGAMRNRPVDLGATLAGAVVAAILLGSQVLADTGSRAPDVVPSSPVASEPGEKDCPEDDAAECGNEHSAAVHAWVRCKAEKGKDVCQKPDPPGKAWGHLQRTEAPGPADEAGRGHAWGRAHAPGQLKKAAQADDGKSRSDDSGD
jgi:hypothetical protein